jgi:hypothetical protein
LTESLKQKLQQESEILQEQRVLQRRQPNFQEQQQLVIFQHYPHLTNAIEVEHQKKLPGSFIPNECRSGIY